MATTPHDSNDNSDDSADKAAKPRATNKADKATRRKARTCGDRLQERDGDMTAIALRRCDCKVTATAAVVGETAPQQQRRSGLRFSHRTPRTLDTLYGSYLQ